MVGNNRGHLVIPPILFPFPPRPPSFLHSPSCRKLRSINANSGLSLHFFRNFCARFAISLTSPSRRNSQFTRNFRIQRDQNSHRWFLDTYNFPSFLTISFNSLLIFTTYSLSTTWWWYLDLYFRSHVLNPQTGHWHTCDISWNYEYSGERDRFIRLRVRCIIIISQPAIV